MIGTRTSTGLWLAVMVAGISVAFSGCADTRLKFDKAAMLETKRIAIVEYNTALNIKFYKDPQTGEQPGMAGLQAALSDPNGEVAASNAMDGFINHMNSNSRFRFMGRDEVLASAKFGQVANGIVARQKEADRIAQEKDAEAKAKMGTVGSVMSFMGISTNAPPPRIPSAGPKGFPTFGLYRDYWKNQQSAMGNTPEERQYVKDALAALDVDAVMIVTDKGASYNCAKACIAGSGSITTGSAFVISMVDKTGNILEMREWFAYGDGNSAAVNYVVNKFNDPELFKGHGIKMAKVFLDYYKDEGGK